MSTTTYGDPLPRMAPGLGWAGIWLGLALGGFFDGIMLHQVLQWHHMLSAADNPDLTGLRLNIIADGLFHAATWMLALLGLIQLWRARYDLADLRRPTPFVGAILAGAGLFNLLEGTINHHLLGLHHVNETVPPSQWWAWDLAFLASGAALLTLGWWMARRL